MIIRNLDPQGRAFYSVSGESYRVFQEFHMGVSGAFMIRRALGLYSKGFGAI